MKRPIVTVNEGKLQGTTLRSVLGIDYFAFKGIPYAQPPIGPLRFTKPQPPLKWPGLRDASKHCGDIPMQYRFDMPEPVHDITGSENCLFLNIYTNNIDYKRPVMFYIHGGGFVEGTGNDCIYRQDYLVSLDMILVCVNYRLGPLGFLNLGNTVISGNQGLRDIIFALKWVQQNIKAFGGDPDNVTIFGNSAGSMISHLFTLIPATKGLFHKAILQSGLMFILKHSLREDNSTNGFKIASLLGFDSDDPIKVMEFLRTVPAEKLVRLQSRVLSEREKNILDLMDYEPIYDYEYTDDPVIPMPLSELLKNDANIPIIVGHNSHESLLSFVGQLDNDQFYKFYDDNIEEVVKSRLCLQDPSRFPEIMKDLRTFYLKNKPINKENVWNLVNLMSDVNTIHPNRKLIDLRNEHATAPTYVYNFSYLGSEPTFYTFDEGPQPLRGVAHADELSYLFYITYMKKNNQFPLEGTKDRLVLERMIRMWYNFALTGNPTPYKDDRYITTIWKPSEKNNLFYLDIGDELILNDDKNLQNRLIYQKFRDIYLI